MMLSTQPQHADYASETHKHELYSTLHSHSPDTSSSSLSTGAPANCRLVATLVRSDLQHAQQIIRSMCGIYILGKFALAAAEGSLWARKVVRVYMNKHVRACRSPFWRLLLRCSVCKWHSAHTVRVCDDIFGNNQHVLISLLRRAAAAHAHAHARRPDLISSSKFVDSSASAAQRGAQTMFMSLPCLGLCLWQPVLNHFLREPKPKARRI